MSTLNSLIVPKNVGGVLWAFSTSIPLQNRKQIEAGPFGEKNPKSLNAEKIGRAL